MENKKNITTSVIIVTYNSKKFIKPCLKSVFNYLNNAEIIIVDNASADGSVKYFQNLNNKGKIKSIFLDDNIGFGAANNRGVLCAKGKYLLFLNSDTLLYDDPVTNGIGFLEKHKDAAVYSCMLRNRDGTIQPNGGYFPNLINLIAWQFFIDDLPVISTYFPSVHPKAKRYQNPRHFDWLTGAFMLIPKKIFEKIGGFDENIFMYTEEMELCYRFRKIGKYCYYDPTHNLTHFGGGSGGNYLAITLEIKNLIYFFRKHKPYWQLPIVITILFCGCLLRWLIFGIIMGDGQAKKAYLDALKNLA